MGSQALRGILDVLNEVLTLLKVNPFLRSKGKDQFLLVLSSVFEQTSAERLETYASQDSPMATTRRPITTAY